MKIVVFVTQFYQLSGAEKLAINFAKTAKNAGHDVVILCMYRSNHPKIMEAAPSIEQTAGCPICYLDLPVSPGITDILTGIIRLRKYIQQKNIDIVEASMVGPSTISALATLGLPTVCLLGIHAIFEKDTHRGVRFTLLKQALRLNKKAKIYCVSEAANQAWAKFSPRTSNPRKTIYNAIDDEFIGEASNGDSHGEISNYKNGNYSLCITDELSIPAQTKIILFVGSLVKNKGIDIAISAAAPLLQRGKCHLLLVGEAGKIEQFNPGNDAFYQSFYNKAKALEQAGVLTFLGHRSDIASLMHQSTVLLHPARSEGFGLVIAEALACGLPVVTSRSGGIPEVVGDCPAALLCDAEDTASFRQSLENIFSKSISELSDLKSAAQRQGTRFTPAHRTEILLSYALGSED